MEQPPKIDSDNPFDLVAYLLFSIRHAFEDEPSDRPPRWVRIARTNSAQGGIDGIGQGVKTVMGGFTEALSWMSDIILDIEALLIQTDAAKALAEVTLKFLQAATSKEFTDGVQALTGTDIDFGAVEEVNSVLADIEPILDYIPEPDDLTGVGHELYRMLSVVQRPLPPRIPNLPGPVGDDISLYPGEHVIYSSSGGTGKLRLLQWAFELDYTVRGLRKDPDADKSTQVVKRLGARRLFDSTSYDLPILSELAWSRDEIEVDIFRFSYDEDDKSDLVAANLILDALDYRYYPPGSGSESKTPEQATDADRKDLGMLPRRLMRFQMVNDLPLTGSLDNDTLNRLFGLDHARKNLARPKPFDPEAVIELPAIEQSAGYFPLANHDAEAPHNPITIHADPDPDGATYNRYRYYHASTLISATAPGSVEHSVGWLHDNRPTIQVPGRDNGNENWVAVSQKRGFVGLESRKLRPPHEQFGNREIYDYTETYHWWYSEGESASGQFFFCARGVQPWIPGRFASPPPADPGSLFGPHDGDPPIGVFSQMYQWVDLDVLHQLRADSGDNPDLYLTASALQRSLFREFAVDQGRIRVELYTDDEYAAVYRPGLTPDTFPLFAQSPWYPNSESVEAGLHLSYGARKRNWVHRATPALQVPTDKTKALLVLEGKLNNGWDIDAYFDDVRLRWELRKATDDGN